MKTAIISLTKNGGVTAMKIKDVLTGEIDVFNRVPPEPHIHTTLKRPLKKLMDEIFSQYDRFIMVMAVGIVVRTIAPLMTTKDKDPAVVVVDERGTFAVSLLSGHLGGANDLALELERKLGPIAVVTTATDINNTIAFDMVAKRNGCVIHDIRRLAKVSSAVVNGRPVLVQSEFPIAGELPCHISLVEEAHGEESVIITNKAMGRYEGLIIRPKNLIVGIGCRRGTSYKRLNKALRQFMNDSGYAAVSLAAIASVDLKADEKGLVKLSKEKNIPFYTYDSEELRKVVAAGTGSAFVADVTGTPSVAEAAALCHTIRGVTVVPKTVVEGITFSLAQKPTEIKFD